MPVYHRGQQGDPLFRRYIRQSDQPSVRKIVAVDQFAEVGIYRYQDAPLRYRNFQQGPVTRIGAEGLRFQDVVPLCAEPFGEAASGAAVHQEPHASTFDNGNRSERIS